VDLANLGTIIRERRAALGLTQARLAQLSGVSRQTLVGLEAGALRDLGFNRVAQVLAVLGLDLDPPSAAARSRKRGLWMAAKNASVSYVHEVPPDTLSHALVSGSVPEGYAAHLTHLLDEAPVGGRRAQGCMAQCCEARQVTGGAPTGPMGVMTT
jgi:transcriptional regulator with XRE-family HTH domain